MIKIFAQIRTREFLVQATVALLVYLLIGILYRLYFGEVSSLTQKLPVISWLYFASAVWILWKLHNQGIGLSHFKIREISYLSIAVTGVILYLLLLGIAWTLYEPYFKGNLGQIFLTKEDLTWNEFSLFRWVHLRIMLFAPVAEELLFRGFLLSKLTSRFGSPKALIITSVCFGVLHSDFFGKIVVGLLFGVLLLKTRNISIPIVCHIIVNTLSICTFYFVFLIRWVHCSLNLVPSPLILGCIFVVPAGVYVTVFIRNNWPGTESKIIGVS